MVFGIYVAQDDIESSQLEGLLNEEFQVINASVPGWGSRQQLIELAYILEEFKPRKVIWVFTPVNDVVDNIIDHMILSPKFKKPVFHLGDKGNLIRPDPPMDSRRRTASGAAPRIYQLAYKVYKRLDPGKSLVAGLGSSSSLESLDNDSSTASIYLKHPSENFRSGIKLTAKILEKAKLKCLEVETDIIFVAFSLGDDELPQYVLDSVRANNWKLNHFSVKAAQERLREIQRVAGIWFNFFQIPEGGTFANDGHMNAKGDSSFAQFLNDLVIEQG